jgi:peptidyl-tRNA hydrolase
VRGDLKFTSGEAAAQAGHAFLDSFLKAPPDLTQAYVSDGGTKIVLSVHNEAVLRAAYAAAQDRGLPCALVIEDDGTPTALGIGPIDRNAAKPITKKFSLMK